ncbi:CoA ester lyase [Thalassotalea sp. HSM 43]|uniref:HpcH/HpaI aldolase/citrate lyase family protein n=1 Tax=Thalassotalea sp. HSM 43 TaxID=2552945 RepID=UPI001081554C|nr:CoA ester lyase [Thalassotalea sp. HSM 43]QBY04583.1 CoA ester lyase [Thalassotalea sp. HSM 43]
MATANSLPLLRSLLFVPGSRADRFSKAHGAGADAICIDLEDAVLPSDKGLARQAVIDYLNNGARVSDVVIRVNHLLSDTGVADIKAIVANNRHPAAIMLPKTANSEEVAVADELLSGTGIALIGLLETVSGVQNAAAIACASERVEALMFGGADYSAEIGCAFGYQPLLLARMQLCQAKAAKAIQLIDVPHINMQDLEQCYQETMQVKDLGFTAKSAIHPKQLDAIHNAFTPSKEEISDAKAIVDAVTSDDAGVLVVNGRMIDRPIILSAKRTMALAKAAGVDE